MLHNANITDIILRKVIGIKTKKHDFIQKKVPPSDIDFTRISYVELFGEIMTSTNLFDTIDNAKNVDLLALLLLITTYNTESRGTLSGMHESNISSQMLFSSVIICSHAHHTSRLHSCSKMRFFLIISFFLI